MYAEAVREVVVVIVGLWDPDVESAFIYDGCYCRNHSRKISVLKPWRQNQVRYPGNQFNVYARQSQMSNRFLILASSSLVKDGVLYGQRSPYEPGMASNSDPTRKGTKTSSSYISSKIGMGLA